MPWSKHARPRLLLLILSILVIVSALALPFTAQQPRPVSPIAPLKPLLSSETLASGEKLIPLPPEKKDSNKPLTEYQKILHLLNRAGFGPRPGDIERVRQMGIERYLDQQLHPEDLNDEFLTRPLLAFNTLQMSNPEMIQFFAPPSVRPAPTPVSTPAPTPALAQISTQIPAPAVKPLITAVSKSEGEDEVRKREPIRGEAAGQQNSSDAMPAPSATKQQPQPNTRQTSTQTPTPTPASRRDPQQPLRELQQAKLLRAVFSEKQLQEVMVDFWFNHFNVFAGKDSARWMVTSYERDVIRPHSMGKFKDLLAAVAQSPAMLYYLDNFMSQAEVRAGDQQKSVANSPVPPLTPSPAPARRPGLNENYARELMELHTLGVDGGYTQQDVIEVARCFTGWTIVPQPNSTFVFRPRIHDKGEKVVLGKRIPAGGGIEDGLRVLDILVKHPSTAKFISRKLCRRFVADDPPASLVDRVAGVFSQTDGNISEVVRAIFASPEFYSPRYYRNKIKSPLELTASAIRTSAASTDGALSLIQWVSRMGEPLYLNQAPTGYDENSSQWLSNATLLERMNFAIALIGNKINGTRVEVSRFVLPDAVKNRDRLLDQLLAALIHSDVSEATRDNLANVVKESRNKMIPAKYDERAARKNDEELIGGLAALILGSREFQVK